MRVKKGWHKQHITWLAAASAIFSGLEVVVPIFQADFPTGLFAVISFAVVTAAAIFTILEHEDEFSQ